MPRDQLLFCIWRCLPWILVVFCLNTGIFLFHCDCTKMYYFTFNFKNGVETFFLSLFVTYFRKIHLQQIINIQLKQLSLGSCWNRVICSIFLYIQDLQKRWLTLSTHFLTDWAQKNHLAKLLLKCSVLKQSLQNSQHRLL